MPDRTQKDAAREILATALRAVDAGDALRRTLTVDGHRLHVGGRAPHGLAVVRAGRRGDPTEGARPNGVNDVDLDIDVDSGSDIDGDSDVNGPSLDLSAVDRIFVVAAGKAARPMIEAAEAILGDRIHAGIGVGGADARGTTATATLYAGGHPLPDPSSLMATRHIQRVLSAATERDVVLVLLSGGASAMLELPPGRLPLIEIAAAASTLLSCGAAIDEVNTVRKHLSAV